MCVVSAIGDDYSRRLPKKWPHQPWDEIVPYTPYPPIDILPTTTIPHGIKVTQPTNQQVLDELARVRNEFAEIKAAVEEMKQILLVAKKYDESNNEPHCEMDEKVATLKKIAEYVGVDLSEIFDK